MNTCRRGSVPGIVPGSSTTGATLFMEPAATVEINNDIVELEDREREEIFRILLELTDGRRRRDLGHGRIEQHDGHLPVQRARQDPGHELLGRGVQLARGDRHGQLDQGLRGDR